MAKVVLVDDHPAIRLAIKVLLQQEGHEIVGETGNGVEAVSIVRAHAPEIVILDIGIPQLNGLEVISRVKTMSPKPRILILTSQPAELFAARCLKAGANGFITKDESLTELQRAIKALISGYSFFPDIVLNTDNPSSTNSSESELLKSLSNREIMVLKRLVIGQSNIEIARDLLLSNKTVSTYKTRLIMKLNATSLVDLIEIAKRNNI
ncbi:response regulator transcription factor [Pseudomonas delhiensis]|nr:response regulator transcription factor [Pseudomonas delhiensis]